MSNLFLDKPSSQLEALLSIYEQHLLEVRWCEQERWALLDRWMEIESRVNWTSSGHSQDDYEEEDLLPDFEKEIGRWEEEIKRLGENLEDVVEMYMKSFEVLDRSIDQVIGNLAEELEARRAAKEHNLEFSFPNEE